MKTVKKLFTIIAIAMFATLLSGASAFAAKKSGVDKKNSYRYDVEYVKSAGTGMSLVRVWSYTNKAKEDVYLSRRNAVHAVIFKGYSGNGATKPALSRNPDAEATFSDFFNAFFQKGGEFERFVTGVSDREVHKYGKEYKIGENVTVNTDALRKYLEQKGVVRGLNTGF